jgi:hypothetical protein
MLSDVNKVYEGTKGSYKNFITKNVSKIIEIYSKFAKLNLNSIFAKT